MPTCEVADPMNSNAVVAGVSYCREVTMASETVVTATSVSAEYAQQEVAAMGKVPIRLREVVYTLSPFEQTVMNGIWKDVPEKLHRKFSENWVDVGVFFIAPVAATFAYANNFLEKEKMHHRH